MKFLRSASGVLSAALLASSGVQAIDLQMDNQNSIRNAAQLIAKEMVSYYTGDRPGDVPGNLPDPYYWWEAGAMFGSLIDYWYYTGDTQFNRITEQALLFQTGPNRDYMPPNQSRTLGNDDQAFWAMAAMSAAEHRFPDPPEDQPQWLSLAQAVFNTQAPRWDNATCAGGLKWQIFTFNNGYNYKNTISNGCFFNLAARLGRYTGNQTYLRWAETAFDWTQRVGLMSEDYHFFDGSDDTINCTQINHIQWSYNAGVYLYGAATMWNITQNDLWRQRTMGILENTNVFFSPDVANVMYEVACEPNGKCNVDQRSFKAYLARWMAASTRVAPFTHDYVMERLRTSAMAAARQCNGAKTGNTCGMKWTTNGVWDGNAGVGEQMCALEVIQSLMIDQVSGPVTNSTGGTSRGDPAAGSQSDANPAQFDTITTGDRVGAGFLTTLVLVGIVGGAWWMIH